MGKHSGYAFPAQPHSTAFQLPGAVAFGSRSSAPATCVTTPSPLRPIEIVPSIATAARSPICSESRRW
jgi:hypothetical protein